MEQVADLWIDQDVPSEIIPPPVQSREQTLPFTELTWENFERLCFRLACKTNEAIDCRRYGAQGQNQQGIDIYVRRLSDGQYDTWQCKRHGIFSPSDIKRAVSEFLENIWAKRSVTFHLAVTISFSPTGLSEAVMEEAKRCRTHGVEFSPLDADQLSVRLKEYPDLVDDFFGRQWVTAFCGTGASAKLSQRILTKSERVKARIKLGELYRTHFSSVDTGLPSFAGALRDAVLPPALHERYIEPLVEAIAVAMESPLPRNESGRKGAETSVKPEDSQSQKTLPGFKISEHRTKTRFSDWLRTVHQAVILAGPGLGKSTALRFIVLDLLSSKPKTEALARKWGNYLPIFVPFAMLTRLVAAQEVVSMTDFLRSWLQKMSAPPETIALLERAVDDERLLLLIDGLDEWNDLTAAATAKVKLLDFVIPRNLPVIASSRHLGYEKLGGFGSDWKRADLLPFESEQQRAFVQGWFEHFYLASSQNDGTRETIQSVVAHETDSFLTEIQQESTLLKIGEIPLFLSALICLRLKGQVLPHNRVDALEAIATTLIIEQPQRRSQASLRGAGPNRQHSRIAERGLENLALAIHQYPGSESMPEDSVREILSEFYQGNEFKKSASDATDLASAQLEAATHEVGILVQREHSRVGFMHRCLQEFLAAKELTHWPFERLKDFMPKHSADPSWRDILLIALQLIQRQDEVDSLLKEIRAVYYFDSFDDPRRQILLARAVFGDVPCSAELAREIVEEVFHKIETSTWMPLRKALLAEVVQGIDSEIVGECTRNRILQWFPGRKRGQWNLFQELAQRPTYNTSGKLYRALFNADSEMEIKLIAEAIALKSKSWPNLCNKLISLLRSPASSDILACALHALSLGWPDHIEMVRLLKEASQSQADNLRCVALIHRAKLGDRSEELKKQLSRFCARRGNIYAWEDDLIQALIDCWPEDLEFRAIALDSARNRDIPTEWNDVLALRYLVKSFPGDDDVADIIAQILDKWDDLRGPFDYHVSWEDVVQGFKNHSKIVPAAEKWLEKQIIHQDVVVHIAKLASTERTKRLLIEHLNENHANAGSIIHALIALDGHRDNEVRNVVLSLVQDDRLVGSLAQYLSLFIEDPEECRKKIISLLKSANGPEIRSILKALSDIDQIYHPKVQTIIETRLKEDGNGAFWREARYCLIKKYSDHPLVRQASLKDLGGPDPIISEISEVYASDAEIRPQLERLIEQLHVELRLELVHALGPLALRENIFSQNLLSNYSQEWCDEPRTAAAHAYYSSIKRKDAGLETHLARLFKEIRAQGPGSNENRVAGIAGLLALDKSDCLKDSALLREGELALQVSIFGFSRPNWEFIRIIVESWESLIVSCGERVWDMLTDRAAFVCYLEQAGKPQILNMPISYLDHFHEGAQWDIIFFRALSILKRGQKSMKDFCLNLLRDRNLDELAPFDDITYYDTTMEFEAAQYLAQYHQGDEEIERELEILAQLSSPPPGAIIALCRGWPTSSIIEKIWEIHRQRVVSSNPATAWIMSIKATSEEVVGYLLSLSKLLRHEGMWFSSSEIIQAIQHRLVNDVNAQTLLLDSIDSNLNWDVIVSTARLLGTVTRNRQLLRKWAQKQIHALAGEKVPPFGYDMISDEMRPVKFCLLEACLS